ncbi:MAG: helix-hairpin-helix domain-containing protein [Gammaproteobacteria bacterium]|nr:helix-hairpin-helix domain-containing protein [Gammaproteobacteria bacterium]MCP5425100.1 helix-hairpin-helix domain-containing protein [Gammaproteobacteria bacterium]
MNILIRALFVLLLTCAAQWGFAQTIDINTATAEELAATLDGVGPAKAAAIVEYRKAQGPFQSVDDLAKVKGIGEKTVENNRSKLSVGDTATPMKSDAMTTQPPSMPEAPPPPTMPSSDPPATKPSN